MAWRDKLLRRLHLCIGALLGVPVILIGLTGSVLVFESELQSWADPVPRATGIGTSHSLVAIMAAARHAAPAGYVPTLVVAPSDEAAPAEVRFSDPKRGPGPGGIQLFVDPRSLAVLGVHRPSESLLRQIFLLHANFMTQDRSGRDIVGWFGVAMCMLGVSGLILWWPSQHNWRAAFTVGRNARGPVLLRQIHGAAGIWSLVVFMIVSFSGVWLAFPQTLNSLAASWLGMRDLRPGFTAMAVKPLPDVSALDADGVAALALDATPGTRLRFIGLPSRPDQPFRVSLLHAAGDPPVSAVTLFVDPWAKRVIERRDPRDYSAGKRLIASMHAIHDGSWLGWPWRLLVFLSGLLPSLFATTGVWMWLLKRQRGRALLASEALGVPGE